MAQNIASLITTSNVRATCISLNKKNLNKLLAIHSNMYILEREILDLNLEIISSLKNLPNHPCVIVLGNIDDLYCKSPLWQNGCDQVFYSKMQVDEIASGCSNIINQYMHLDDRVALLPGSSLRATLKDFITQSPSMKNFMNMVHKIVKTDSSLLILGDTGVGKERLARAMHNDGPRANTPFITINCAAIPENLLESELLGHEEGAFTGATRQRKGAFEMANFGTIFLDEIGDMPLHLQVKLLRVIQEQEFTRVGGSKLIRVNVRVIAATNHDLPLAVETGKFRRDLYYRLSVFTLKIPSLIERKEDIPGLLNLYLHLICERLKYSINGFSSLAMNVLTSHSWPGNIRELINVVERAVLLCDDNEICIKDLPSELVEKNINITALPIQGEVSFSWKQAKEQAASLIERQYFINLLAQYHGVINLCAKKAEITPRALYEKMKKYDLTKEQFKK